MGDFEYRRYLAGACGRLLIEHPFDYQQANRRTASAEGLVIDVPSNGKTEPQTLTMSRGLGVRGIIRDPAGKPVSGAIIQANNTTAAGSASANSNSDGRFEMSGLSPQAKSVLYVRSGSGAFHSIIEAKPIHPVGKVLWQDLDIRLRPAVTLTGKVLFKGQPRAGVLLKAFRTPTEQLVLGITLGETRTDRLGNFRMTGFEAGDRYRFDIDIRLVDTTPRSLGPRQSIIPKGSDELEGAGYRVEFTNADAGWSRGRSERQSVGGSPRGSLAGY